MTASSHSPRSRRGFTLIEVAVASLIGAMLILVVGTMFRTATRGFSASNEKLDALQAATMISEIMHRDLRYMAFPLLAPPTATNQALVTASNTPADPTAGTPPGPGPTPTVGTEQLVVPETMSPFTKWNQAEGRPEATEADVWDMTLEASKPFVFFRTKTTSQSGGLFSLGASTPTAGYDLQRITYEVVPSKRYESQKLFGLQRTVEDVKVRVDDTTRKETVEVLGQASKRLYSSYYFRRLILSLHEAPEAGIATGAPAPAGPVPTTPVIPGSAAPLARMDRLFFCRIMIAGASAGSGARAVKDVDDRDDVSHTQLLDLLVNLVHLDGVTERFRSRSLARNWNSELPTPQEN